MSKWFLRLVFLLWALPAAAALNLNTATQAELEELPGIGPRKALDILQYRADHGPFRTVDDLDAVSGIGPSTMANVRDLVMVGPNVGPNVTSAPTASSAAAAPAVPVRPPPVAGACPVNINTADAAGLRSMPEIGESKAEKIVQSRTDGGPFASCDDLDRVSGIGPATIAKLRACCTVR